MDGCRLAQRNDWHICSTLDISPIAGILPDTKRLRGENGVQSNTLDASFMRLGQPYTLLSPIGRA